MTTVADMAKQIAALDGFLDRAAPAAAKAVQAAIQADLAAGKQPGGGAWKATKEGKRPLERAAQHVQTVAVGTVLLSRIVGQPHWFIHNQGTKSMPKRGLLPDAGIPAPVAAAISRTLDTEFRKATGG